MVKQSVFQIMDKKFNQETLSELESLSQVDITETNELKQTPLHIAVLNNQLAVAAIILNKGFSPDDKDQNMLSPFIAAAANGLSDMFQLLLEYSPNVCQTNRFGGTALLPSSEKGFIRVVQKALDGGVPVNHINRLGWSALLEAVILGDEGFLFRDIVEELVAFDANPLIEDFEGLNAIDYAKKRKSLNILPILEQKEINNHFKKIKEQIRNNQFYLSIKELQKMPVSLEQIYYLGFTYECLGDYQAANYYYKKGSKDDTQFYYYLANLAKKMGQINQAINFFETGAKFANNSEFFDYHRSNYLRELGRHEEAINVMDKLLELDSKRVDYLFHKANSLRSLNRHQETYDVMLKASNYQPENNLFKEHAAQSQLKV